MSTEGAYPLLEVLCGSLACFSVWLCSGLPRPLLSPDADGRTSVPLPAFQQSTFVSQGGQVRMKVMSWRTRFPPGTSSWHLSLGAALPPCWLYYLSHWIAMLLLCLLSPYYVQEVTGVHRGRVRG